ncbi:flagellar motor protein MotB [Pikeienuella sp. HZG-20]|uniref:OmpA/MotB family protein n=1 Tax=Paludibacillus litoralis TaxID=3133267 RepID=UPI0030EBA78B
MRRLERHRARAEEEESVFVTMTDMTISFLLIIIILLAFFATQLNDDETVPLTAYERVRQERDALRIENQDLRSSVEALKAELAHVTSELETVTAERDRLHSELDQLRDENEALRTRVAELEEENGQLRSQIDQLFAEIERLREKIERLHVVNPLEAYLSQAIAQRREILVNLRDRLLIEFPEVQVVISPEQDALRFQGEGLFRSGSSRLEPRQRAIAETMGRLLDEILVCFTLGERAARGPDCRSGNALIEAVQIEGHTDSDGSDLNNLRLSTDRANATLLVMFDEDRTILAHQNLRGQPVMSVSGYGEMRPIETNETTEGKAANRRIDLRIIMYAPSTVGEVEEVGRRLDALRAAGRSE